jgi:hypothetical protein
METETGIVEKVEGDVAFVRLIRYKLAGCCCCCEPVEKTEFEQVRNKCRALEGDIVRISSTYGTRIFRNTILYMGTLFSFIIGYGVCFTLREAFNHINIATPAVFVVGGIVLAAVFFFCVSIYQKRNALLPQEACEIVNAGSNK